MTWLTVKNIYLPDLTASTHAFSLKICSRVAEKHCLLPGGKNADKSLMVKTLTMCPGIPSAAQPVRAAHVHGTRGVQQSQAMIKNAYGIQLGPYAASLANSSKGCKMKSN